ncbi:hypothetical protein GH714_031526 [Hevea brasiliensis]|uniref:Myb/SANT-like domain-containing protein n=1 Tax=Hevea brasiliensis TaxID=3981 RepID=A0A6A6LND0_HEVBR|nr:hypothetical protein GH714_031455 [Hevea brasiliensis]KAF2302027.1 hypothetical protein GH714_031526 [Hevea brasiliensis]
MSAAQDGILGRPKAEWTPTRDAYLVELFVEQHNRGRTAYNEFKNEVIRSVAHDFNKKFDLNLEENQIKNHYNVMKKDYGIVKIFLSHTEFGWAETHQMVIADDKVWGSYICKQKSFAASARGRKRRVCDDVGETFENALCDMFSTATLRTIQRNVINEKTIYQKCLEELPKLEELNDTEFTKAINVLKGDKNATAFMTIRGPRRVMLLKSLWQA